MAVRSYRTTETIDAGYDVFVRTGSSELEYLIPNLSAHGYLGWLSLRFREVKPEDRPQGSAKLSSWVRFIFRCFNSSR